MSVEKGHKIIKILPTIATQEIPHKTIYLHNDEPYDPPTYINNTLYQCSNRPNAHTPSAFTWHLRYACKCASVLQHTQQHVDGLQIRQGTIKDLPKLLPCSACLAGKLNKNRKQPVRNYTDVANLANYHNVPLSVTGATRDHNATPNTTISVDLGILNKKLKKDVNNVFLLILDIHTGGVRFSC